MHTYLLFVGGSLARFVSNLSWIVLTSSVVYTTANSVFNIYVRISMKSTPSISAGNDNLISLLKEFLLCGFPQVSLYLVFVTVLPGEKRFYCLTWQLAMKNIMGLQMLWDGNSWCSIDITFKRQTMRHFHSRIIVHSYINFSLIQRISIGMNMRGVVFLLRGK